MSLDMKISVLKTFITVAEAKSMSKAADMLYLTQPAVSKHIKTLEKLFNVDLLHRHGHKVSLTEEGDVFYRQAKETIKVWENSVQVMHELSDKVGGTLRIGASTIPGEYLLPYLLGCYKKQYPEVELKLEIGDTVEIVRKILDEEIHLGAVGAWIERKKLMAKKFAEDKLVLIIPPGHPLTKKDKIHPFDLIKEKLIRREKGSGTRRVVEEKLSEFGVPLKELKPVLELGSTQAIITSVEAGLGISFVSSWAVCKEAASKRLETRDLEGISLNRDLYFLYPRKQYLPKSALKLLKFSDEFDLSAHLKNNYNY